jgi:hypothetical protein
MEEALELQRRARHSPVVGGEAICSLLDISSCQNDTLTSLSLHSTLIV